MTMKTIQRAHNFPITIKQEEISRILGYGDTTIPGRVLTMLEEIGAAARGLIEPACAYRTLTADEIAASAYLRGIEQAALCLVTIGGKLEAAVEKEKNVGDLSRAIILDTYGSAAAEACADAAEALINGEINKQGLKCSRRFSPGYSGWDVAEQKWVLPALEGEELGVTLTEGCMMVPRKSITFAVTIGENPVEMRRAASCEVCGLLNCKYRHTDDNSTKGE
jgi:hypothetical protein